MPVARKIFETVEACAEALADALAVAINERLSVTNRASLVLSGGNSPKAVLPLLAQASIAWSEVDVLLSDERWVPPTHERSNAGMIEKYFLRQGANQSKFHPMWLDTLTPDAAISRVDRTLASVSRPFDIAYLGMGTDGHFASLFPTDNLAKLENEEAVVISANAPSVPRERISLTLSALMQTRMIFLHATGAEKTEVFRKAENGSPDPGCPISLLIHDYPGELQVYLA